MSTGSERNPVKPGAAGFTALLLAVTLLAAAAAQATPLITYPAEGQTVMNAKGGAITFRWTLAEGEAEPQVYVGDTPNYNHDPESEEYLAPFKQYCGAGFGETETSCTIPGGTPFAPGTHYAFVAGGPGGQAFFATFSPLVRFIVPAELGWGCSPGEPRCGYRPLYNEYIPGGDGTYPWTTDVIKVSGWSNAPSLEFVFTVSHGRKLIKRLHTTVLTEAEAIAFPGVKLFHVPGMAPGTPLTLTVQMSAGGATLTRSVKARSGGGPKRGVTLF